MGYRVFFLNKLKDGVAPADYEAWVREVAHPFARGAQTIDAYSVSRLDASLDGDDAPPYDFVEVVEVSDIEAYKAELSPDRPEVKAFDEEWFSYVAETVAVHGEVVE